MQSSAQLKELLHSINRKSYPAYKSLRGAYQFDRYILSIDHVQGDPFASPSHISVKLSHRDTKFPEEYYKDSLTRITLGDFLNRQFEQLVNHYTFRAKGSGKSGLISVSHCGQEVLARTACEISENGINARFFIGFPANGRTINAFALGAQMTNPRAQIELRGSCVKGTPQADLLADGIRVVSNRDAPTQAKMYLDFCNYGTYQMNDRGDLIPLGTPVWVWG